MCRSIVTLRGEQPATDDEVRAAALQFVRKVSGFRVPSKANEAVFAAAVEEIAHATEHLLQALVVPPSSRPPAMARSRIVAREKAARQAHPHDHAASGAAASGTAARPS